MEIQIFLGYNFIYPDFAISELLKPLQTSKLFIETTRNVFRYLVCSEVDSNWSPFGTGDWIIRITRE